MATFDANYFASLRRQEEPFWKGIKAIRASGYPKVEDAAAAALRRIWYRSWLEGVEWGGVLFKHANFFGVGTPQTTRLAFAVSIEIRGGPPGATFQGAYHTHVNVPTGDAAHFSDHDREQSKGIKGPIYFANPDREIYEVRPFGGGVKEQKIGTIDEPPLPEVYKDSRPPDGPLRQLLEQHRQWRLSQIP